MLDQIKHSDFENLDDKTFEIDFGEAGTLEATLEKTSGFSIAPAEGKRTPFSIFLRSAGPPIQQTYSVRHEKLGTLELFLVPIEENDEGVLFEAVFT